MVWHVAHCEETSGFSVDSPNRLFHSHRRVSPRVVLGGPEGSRGVESDACSTPLTTDSDERDMKGALPSRRFNRSRQECFYGCLIAGTGSTPLRAERFWGDTVYREWFLQDSEVGRKGGLVSMIGGLASGKRFTGCLSRDGDRVLSLSYGA